MIDNSDNGNTGSIRGGANEGKLGTSKRRNTSPKKRDEIEEDIEDEDDDDDEHDLDRGRLRNSKFLGKSKISSKSKKSGKRRGKRSNNAAQLVPWGSSRPSVGGKKRKSSIGFSSIKNRLEGIAKTGQAAYKDLYRKAKVLKSSAFEGILLKATWPGNDPVPAELLSEIVKYSIPSFKYARLVGLYKNCYIDSNLFFLLSFSCLACRTLKTIHII